MAVGFAGKTRIAATGKQEEGMKVSEADHGVRAEAASAKKFMYGFLEDPGIDDVRSLLGGSRSHGHVFGRIASISLGMGSGSNDVVDVP